MRSPRRQAVTRWVNAQARGQQVDFSGAHLVGRGTSRIARTWYCLFTGERLVKPLRREYSLSYHGTTHMPVRIDRRKAYDEAHAFFC